MPKLFMLIGVSGSGKSTWANFNKDKPDMFTEIFSSDDYRQKLFNDVNDQSHNIQVFNRLHRDIIAALASGKNVCYDATNLTKHTRNIFLKQLSNLANIYKIAVVFDIPEAQVRSQNRNRNRIVPDDVITKQLLKFNSPTLNEFDQIMVVSN